VTGDRQQVTGDRRQVTGDRERKRFQVSACSGTPVGSDFGIPVEPIGPISGPIRSDHRTPVIGDFRNRRHRHHRGWRHEGSCSGDVPIVEGKKSPVRTPALQSGDLAVARGVPVTCHSSLVAALHLGKLPQRAPRRPKSP
jgi:hypothetical protein